MFSSRLKTLRNGLSPFLSIPIRRKFRTQPLRRFATQQAPNSSTVINKKGIKALMSKYGYTALFIYIGLTLIDLPLCFLLVHSLGKDKIEIYKEKAKKILGMKEKPITDDNEVVLDENDKKSGSLSRWDSFKRSPLLTEFLIAYGIHKSLIIVRLPLTAAITPGMVKILKHWGFQLGKKSNVTNTLGTNAPLRYRTSNPNDIIKPNIKDPNQIHPSTTITKKHKWFNGIM
ncbi:Nat2p NDAI_0H00520 [Naumovozyma dairenensis CBS 421]|uniref:DUF1279 domain-containing protein n=1 Tax=Naumovozyma dairenensis (strain ATCC 10597 / BCRC 20456 / CBS 421 / NBRC 0211 / NRRL Y-12639) TaxID=1071378 RepID=G0WEL5_NAUDC|nr:hypothetical protein NDAI_0H00520 [Naumovozyma dairenensis CBS 421]CCD26226.1 hypothetical protein NDAI_0H00520 [Naumovozyma dairenensis CBS 421]